MMMRRHGQVTLGMLMEHLRPFALSLAYCAGKGVCRKPENGTVPEIEMGSTAQDVVVEHFDDVDWDEALQELEQPEGEDDEEEVEKNVLEEGEDDEIPECEAQGAMASKQHRFPPHGHRFPPHCFK